MEVIIFLIICGVVFPCVVTAGSVSNDTELLLQRYEYVVSSWQEYGRRATGEEIQQGIRDLQFMAGIGETGLLDPVTEDKLKGRRCGVTDDMQKLRNNIENEHRGFEKSNLTWSIVRYDRRTASALDQVSETLQSAFEYWQSTGVYSFKEIKVPNEAEREKADIRIFFHVGGYNYIEVDRFGREGDIISQSSYPDGCSRGEIHFDSSENWDFNRSLPSDDLVTLPTTPSVSIKIFMTASAGGGVSLYSATIHQIGHVLGLEHSRNSSSVMYPWYNETAANIPSLDITEKQALSLLHQRAVEVAVGARSENMTPTADSGECPLNIDAVLHARDHTFYYKDHVFWSLDKRGAVSDRGALIHTLWYDLPEHLTSIDAAYYEERGRKPEVVIFTGKKYYTLHSNFVEESIPEEGRPIADFCLLAGIKKVDAAFVWPHNNNTYIISEDKYWRLGKHRDKVSCEEVGANYPKNMRVWKGVRLPVDAAESHDGFLYFYHKEHYWKFDDENMQIDEGSRRTLYTRFGCTDRNEEIVVKQTTQDTSSSVSVYSHSIIATMCSYSIVAIILTVLYTKLF